MDDKRTAFEALEAALAGEVAYLPLEEPPFEQTTYALEVHVIGATRTFLLLADPMRTKQFAEGLRREFAGRLGASRKLVEKLTDLI